MKCNVMKRNFSLCIAIHCHIFQSNAIKPFKEVYTWHSKAYNFLEIDQNIIIYRHNPARHRQSFEFATLIGIRCKILKSFQILFNLNRIYITEFFLFYFKSNVGPSRRFISFHFIAYSPFFKCGYLVDGGLLACF